MLEKYFIYSFLLATFFLAIPKGVIFAQDIPSAIKLEVSLSIQEGEKNFKNFDKAKKYFQNALEISKQYAYEFGIFRSSYYLGKLYIANNQIDSGLSYLSVFRYYEPDYVYLIRPYEFEALEILANIYFGRSEFYLASHYISKLIKFKESYLDYLNQRKTSDIQELTKYYYQAVKIYFNLALFDTAYYYASKCLDYANQIKDSETLGLIYNSIGSIYYQWNLFDNALENYLKAVEYKKEAKDTATISITLNNIGLIFAELGHLDLAYSYHYQALTFALKAPKKNISLGYCYNSIGKYFLEKNNLDSAKYYFELSIKAYESSDKENGMALNYYDLANLYYKAGAFQNSIDLAQKILNHYEKIGNIRRIALVKTLIARNYIELKKYDIAKKYAIEAANFAKDIKQKNIEREIYSALSEIYSAFSDFQNAYYFVKKSYEIQKEINKNKQKEILNAAELKKLSEIKKFEKLNKELKLESKKFLYSWIISCLVFVLALTIIIVNYIKTKKTLKEEIASAKLLISNYKTIVNNLSLEVENLKSSAKIVSDLSQNKIQPSLLKSYSALKDLYLNKKLFDEKNELEYLSTIREELFETYNNYEILSISTLFLNSELNSSASNFSLLKIIDEVINSLNLRLENKSISVRTQIKEDITANSYENIVRVIIRDILLNLTKYVPGSVIILYIKKIDEINSVEFTFSLDGDKQLDSDHKGKIELNEIEFSLINREKISNYDHLNILLQKIKGQIIINKKEKNCFSIIFNFEDIQDNRELNA